MDDLQLFGDLFKDLSQLILIYSLLCEGLKELIWSPDGDMAHFNNQEQIKLNVRS